MKTLLRAILLAGLLEASPVLAQQQVVETQPLPRQTTNASSTISVTDTFQQIWPLQDTPGGVTRSACAIQNNGTHTMWVFSGSGTATKGTSVVLPAGAMYSCASSGVVTVSAISVTGTAGDAFFAGLEGAPGLSGTGGGGGGGTAQDVNVTSWGGAATTLGQKVMASSVPVVIASDQSPVTVLSTGQTATGTASASFTSGTTAYAANDVVGASGANAALTFTALCPASANIMVTGLQLEVDSGTLISGQTSYIVYLYNVTPPSALVDSTAWDLPSGDRASYLGGGTTLTIPAIADLGSTLYAEVNSLNKQVQCAASGNLFGYLVSVGAYTPTAQVYKLTIHATPL